DMGAVRDQLPPGERGLWSLSSALAAVTEVGTEVFAVGIHHGEPAGLGPPSDQLLIEVLHLVDVADTDLSGPGDLEPSGRFHRQRRLSHLSCPPRVRMIGGAAKKSQSPLWKN